MRLTLVDIAALIGVSPATTAGEVTGYSIDSRTLRPGDLFFAVRGERLDGHDYAVAALRAGAAAVVVERELPALPPEKTLYVKDALAAMQELARQVRRRWGGEVVAVTGSAGKTTTKEMIAAVLGMKLRVLKTEGNLNNQFGLPLTLLRLEPEDEVTVVELGMNHAGEIARLAEICEPNVAVFTNVGEAHLGNFTSIEGVAAAKRELAEAIPASGTLVLNAGDARVARFGTGLAARQAMYGGDETALAAVPELHFPGRHNRSNAAAALAVGALFHVPEAAARAALEAMTPPPGRGQTILSRGATLLNDTYNANPAAMRAMLAVLAATPGRRRIAVLGEMRELGDSGRGLHQALGREAAAYNAQGKLDALFAVQGEAVSLLQAAIEAGFRGDSQFFPDAGSAGIWLRNYLRAGDVALFKASRAVKLEQALEAVTADTST